MLFLISEPQLSIHNEPVCNWHCLSLQVNFYMDVYNQEEFLTIQGQMFICKRNFHQNV